MKFPDVLNIYCVANTVNDQHLKFSDKIYSDQEVTVSTLFILSANGFGYSNRL